MLPGPLRRARSGLYVPAASGGGASATYVTGGTYAFVGGAETGVTFDTTGAADNDLLVIIVKNNGIDPTLSLQDGVGTNAVPNLASVGDSGGFSDILYAKVLTSGERTTHLLNISASAAGGGFGLQYFIYRGAGTVTSKGHANASPGTSTDLAFSSYTPSGSSKGELLVSFDSANDAGTVTAANFTARRQAIAVGGGYFHAYLLERTAGSAGAAVTETGYATTGGQSGYILELT